MPWAHICSNQELICLGLTLEDWIQLVLLPMGVNMLQHSSIVFRRRKVNWWALVMRYIFEWYNSDIFLLIDEIIHFHKQIIFGPNSTTLVFHMARSLGSHFKNLWVKENATEKSIPSGPWQMPRKKFNIVVTNLEHDTNVSPFVRMAEDLEVNSIVHFISWEKYYRQNCDIVMTCLILIMNCRI